MNLCERRCGRVGFGEDIETGMWVCAKCNNPTRVYFENGLKDGDIRLLVVTPMQYATGYQRLHLDKREVTHHGFRKVREDEHGNVIVVTPREGYRHP